MERGRGIESTLSKALTLQSKMKTESLLLILGMVSKISPIDNAAIVSEISAITHVNEKVSISEIVSHRVIHTSSGPVRGTITRVLSIPVQTYLGIPYAKPPIGDLRFRKTVPVDSWTETLEANRMPPACIQYATYPFPWYDPEPNKSEDCLYLNIWTPIDATAGSKKAVMFWIYGGGPYGSNKKPEYDGRVLAGLGDVIIVSPNFRVGLLGFLTSATEDLPGNFGIWDLLMALKWVRMNIESFGGDPDRITLHGESSGSIIVSMFCVSPLTKGLFSKAIMESGSAIVLQTNPAQPNVKDSQRLAKAVGCATDEKTIQNDTLNVVNCLRGKDSMYLSKVQIYFNPASDLNFIVQYGDELFPNPPYEDIRNGRFHQVPLLIGNNQYEGVNLVTKLPDLFGFFGDKKTILNKTYATNLLKNSLALFNCSSDEIATHYFDGVDDHDSLRIKRQLYKAVGEITLTCPTTYFAESYANRNNDVYLYIFNHRPSTSPWAKWMGTSHFDEVQFVFGQPFQKPSVYTALEIELSMMMIHYWTSFAKYGSPRFIYDWPKYSSKNHTLIYLEAGFNGIRTGISPSLENCNFVRRCFIL
ncbi:acetylcholinesterase-1 [Nephila pilipes]|uniref:Carboxylic ester hydrolase n=1 Tax=Nephila pilipes TaxID=299642 RepID=A0A8X6NBU8_NEPPI|nr:acetylcholinesterase-1 [Nephila pilipes]